MSNHHLPPVVKPEVWQIVELVRNAAEGKLRIPNFQRPFVWDRNRMLELLDSIRKRYPVGSLLVWDTEERVSSKGTIGLIKIPKDVKGGTSLVLDGHQRISTLTGALIEPSKNSYSEDDPDPERWEIWFNADKMEFEHLRAKDHSEVWHFPMRKLIDTFSFLQECQRMLEKGGKNGQRFVKNTQELLRSFLDQQIPVVKIKNTDLSQAVNIFARLNSTGKKISADEMVAAITYNEERTPLADHIDELAEILTGWGFGKTNRTIILRAILACMGEDIYSTNWSRFDDRKQDDKQDKLHDFHKKLDTVIEAAKISVEEAAKFLHEQLGVKHDRLLPYAQQIVVLAAFFYECKNPTQQQQNFLKRWFWVSSFTGWFASGNPSRVSALVKEMRDKISKNPDPQSLDNMRMDEPAQSFPKYFDTRSARTRTWLLMMLELQPCDTKGDPVEEPWNLVGDYGLSYVAATVKDKDLSSSPANRLLKLNPKDRAQAMNWLITLNPETDGNILASHGVPADKLYLLQEGKRDEFLQERRNHLIDLEKAFMKKKGVALPLNLTPKPAPIDTDMD